MSDVIPVGFEEFFEKEYRSLLGFARLHGAGPDAEDVLQTAFECLLIAWQRLDNPAAWIRTVIAREVWRTRGRQRTLPWDGRAAAADRTEPDQDVLVLDLLSRLPWAERTVMTWEMQGFSIAETAEATGLSTTEVRNARRRARNRLASLMKEH